MILDRKRGKLLDHLLEIGCRLAPFGACELLPGEVLCGSVLTLRLRSGNLEPELRFVNGSKDPDRLGRTLSKHLEHPRHSVNELIVSNQGSPGLKATGTLGFGNPMNAFCGNLCLADTQEVHQGTSPRQNPRVGADSPSVRKEIVVCHQAMGSGEDGIRARFYAI